MGNNIISIWNVNTWVIGEICPYNFVQVIRNNYYHTQRVQYIESDAVAIETLYCTRAVHKITI
jgi:hypothetical protein